MPGRRRHQQAPPPPPPPPPPPAPLRRWGALLAMLALLWVMLFVAVPAAQRHPALAPGVQAIIDSGIEAGAIYYTGVEQVAEAEAAMRGVARPAPP
jgi:hypothetical protein